MPSPGTPAKALSLEKMLFPRIGEWAAARYPGIAGPVVASEPCLYTNTADERFLVERHGRVVAVSACSGHGFQFAPETGRRAAALAAEALGAPVA